MTLQDVQPDSFEVMGYDENQLPDDLAVLLNHIDSGSDASTAAQAAQALENIITELGPDIAKSASRYRGVRCLTKEDFAQIGVVGVFDALARADTSYSIGAFRRYAGHRIHSAQFEHSAQAGGLVNLKEGALKKVMAVTRVDNALEADDSRSLEEIVAANGLTMSSYLRYRRVRALANPLSYHVTLEETEHEVLTLTGETAPDVFSTDPADIHEAKQNVALLAEAIQRLSDREQIVVVLYYMQSMSLAQIGELLGVTESRICQIMGKARTKLKLFYETLSTG